MMFSSCPVAKEDDPADIFTCDPAFIWTASIVGLH